MTDGSKVLSVGVFGGSGFLGTEIVKRLAAQGIKARVAVRHPDSAEAKALSAQSGLIEPIYADVRDETSVALALQGCDAAINTVGLYSENDALTFEAVHEIGAVNVAHQAAALGLVGLVHISGVGANRYSSSSYVRSRGKGELLVADVFERATILRPTLMFGPNKNSISRLMTIIARSPLLPLFGWGKTRLQPVHVGDVAEAVYMAIVDETARGSIYELGGPHTYTYRALMKVLVTHTGRNRLLVPVPFVVWSMLAAAASIMPTPPITEAQVTLMKRDNVVANKALTLEDLGITPTALESFLRQHPFSLARATS